MGHWVPTSSPARLRDRADWMPRRAWVMAVLLAVYAILTFAIIFRTPVLDIDSSIVHLRLRQNHPGWFFWIHAYVNLGQRRPVTQAVLPFLVWKAWRTRSPRPLVALVVALIALNLSVGVVKLATGRLGPRGGHPVDQLFSGGDIYPSGHVSNAVVMYGLVALFVAQRNRRKAVAAVCLICVTVGAGTLYLNTHWLTDVVGGWLAGGLVLCALPWLMPPAERLVARSYSRARAVTSIGLGAVALYLNLHWLTAIFGGWLNDVFGGWLAAGLVLGILPWLTPPLERRVRTAYTQRRARRRTAAADGGGASAGPRCAAG
jgi:membrane-associated phospholipid phosphatase